MTPNPDKNAELSAPGDEQDDDSATAPTGRLSTGLPPAMQENLLSELREISEQVNRMMVQVDRAIDRLGEHTGKPLRR